MKSKLQEELNKYPKHIILDVFDTLYNGYLINEINNFLSNNDGKTFKEFLDELNNETRGIYLDDRTDKELRDKIINIIKKSDKAISLKKLSEKLKTNQKGLNPIITKLLQEGFIYEARGGWFRWLGD